MPSPWDAPLHGAPVQAVVKVNAAQSGKKDDAVVSRNSIGISRGSEKAPTPETYEVDFVYNVEAKNADIFDRTVLPLVRRVMQGYHAACIFVGTSSSGKLDSLNGSKGDPGLLQLAAEVSARRLLTLLLGQDAGHQLDVPSEAHDRTRTTVCTRSGPG